MSRAPTAPTRTRPTVTQRPGRSRLGAVPALTRHVTRTTPWATLFAGCLTGTAVLALLAYAAHQSHTSPDQNTVRFTILPAIAALAFVPRTPFRPLVDATPVPAWLTSAGQTLLAVPTLALTCWVQLLLVSDSRSAAPGIVGQLPAVYPLLAQITGWCALTVTVAACCDRSRYADLGGAVAAPVSLALIALATYAPKTRNLLTTPPASPHAATAAWYTIAGAALVLTYAAMRDRWHRYTRLLSPGAHDSSG